MTVKNVSLKKNSKTTAARLPSDVMMSPSIIAVTLPELINIRKKNHTENIFK